MSRGNILWELAQNVGMALTSTEVWPLLKTPNGHALGLSIMTAPETVLTAVTNGFITAFGAGALCININGSGTSTTFLFQNQGSESAPSWTAVNSVAN